MDLPLRALAWLRASGGKFWADVLVVAFGDPSRRSRVLGSIRDRIRECSLQTRQRR